MENEKDLLMKDLEAATNAAEIKQIEEDANLLEQFDIAELARKKFNALSAQAEGIKAEAAAKTQTIEALGGTPEALQEKVGPIQEEVKQVQQNAEQEIANIETGEKKTIDRELVKKGAILNDITSEKNPIKVEVISDIQETTDPNPREYVRVKFTSNGFETDLLLSKLGEIKKIPEDMLRSEIKTEIGENIYINQANDEKRLTFIDKKVAEGYNREDISEILTKIQNEEYEKFQTMPAVQSFKKELKDYFIRTNGNIDPVITRQMVGDLSARIGFEVGRSLVNKLSQETEREAFR